MFTSLVRKTLQIYLSERRIITQSEIDTDLVSHLTTKDAIFVTLYMDGRVIASSGRIQCIKENSVFECIDNALLCLKDPRFASSLQNPDGLGKIQIRVDRFGPTNRRVIASYEQLDIVKEGIILVSQNLGVLSIVLPNMVHVGSDARASFDLVCKKANISPETTNPNDYVLYAFTTVSESDFA